MEKLVVLGAGESGIGAALLGVKKGYQVMVSDRDGIGETAKEVLSHVEVELEVGHASERIDDADVVIKSPGIPDSAEVIQRLKGLNKEIISEIEFAYRYCNGKIIGVTGSNGKTTTSMLIHHILSNGGLDVALTGNVGVSFARTIAERDYDYYVVELSSFQLEELPSFKPDIAIVLNITPDHLDRYESFDHYAMAKMNITSNQQEGDAFIFCADDEKIMECLQNTEVSASRYPFSLQQVQEPLGAYIANEQLIINHINQQFKMSIFELALQGKHNQYNSMAAGIAAKILDLRKDVIRESLSDFQNVEHRLEFVAKVHGIEFINDSKATNVNSTWYALESMTKPVIWIAGGVDKGNDYDALLDLVKDKVKAIVCLGLDNQKIHKAFGDHVETIVDAATADDAVKEAYGLGRKGEIVLLSPCCASFDLFESYEDRGHQFKMAVKGL